MPLATLTHTRCHTPLIAMSDVIVPLQEPLTIEGKSLTPTTGRDISKDLRAIAGTTATLMLAIVVPQTPVRRSTPAEVGMVIALTTTIRVSIASRLVVPIVATRVIAPRMLRDLADRLMIRMTTVAVVKKETLDPGTIAPVVPTLLASMQRDRGESLYSLRMSSRRSALMSRSGSISISPTPVSALVERRTTLLLQVPSW